MAKRDLERLNNEVASLEEQLQALAKQYEAAMTDRMALQSEAELMERRAIAAGLFLLGCTSDVCRNTGLLYCL